MTAATRPVVASVTIHAPTSVVVIVNVRGDVCDVLKEGERQETRLMEPGEFFLRYTLADSTTIAPAPKGLAPLAPAPGPTSETLGAAAFSGPTAALRAEVAASKAKSKRTAAAETTEVGPEQPRPPGEAAKRLGTIARRKRILEMLEKSDRALSVPQIADSLGLQRADVAYDMKVLTTVDGVVNPRKAPVRKLVGENGPVYQISR